MINSSTHRQSLATVFFGFLAGIFLLGNIALIENLYAESTTPEQAEIVVNSWLTMDSDPLSTALGMSVAKVDSYKDAQGVPVYYIVYLNPDGFVIVSAHNMVEPIIGFAAQGQYDPSEYNPLGALVSRDVIGRVTEALTIESQKGIGSGLEDRFYDAQEKWNDLLNGDKGIFQSQIDDLRVEPFIESEWGQSNVWLTHACYNYYTPPNAAGSNTNYPCGCVATAMAQLMCYYEWPQSGVGTGSYWTWTGLLPELRSLRGGDGNGGSYVWASMILKPENLGLWQDTYGQAIGALTYDASVSVGMNYGASASGADTLDVATRLKDPFQYNNAVKGYKSGNNIGSGLIEMLNPNLDANYPVILGIDGASGGHAVVCDGYGYHTNTIYHHLNMGWSGSDNIYYSLPNIDSSPSFNTITKCVYNIFTNQTHEIISGRVMCDGQPVEGATVTASGTGFSSNTNENGIFALVGVTSGTYDVIVTKGEYSFFEMPAVVGTSSDNSSISGNEWLENPIEGILTTIQAPIDSSTISGTVQVIATATPGDMGSGSVYLYIDGSMQGIVPTYTPPATYTFEWDTTNFCKR